MSLPDAVLGLLEQIHKEQQSLASQVSSMTRELQDHIREEEQLLEKHTAEIVALQSGFPNGDVHGHQLYHASVIKRNEFLADMFKEAAKHIAKYGLLAFIIWLLWHGATDIIHKVLPK